MRLTNDEKNTLVTFCCLLVSLGIFLSVFLIPTRGRIVQSARLMPHIVSTMMVLLSLILFVKSLFKARPGPGTLFRAAIAALKDKDYQRTLTAVGLVAFYCFVAIPYISFYISSIALIMAVSLIYVRRVHPLLSIFASFALTGLFYLIFAVVFKMPLR